MSSFIIVHPVDDNKEHLINTDEIVEMFRGYDQNCEGRTEIHFKTMGPMIVKENFISLVIDLIRPESEYNHCDDDKIAPITAEIVDKALYAWKDDPCGDCGICKFNDGTEERCEAKYIADYINKKMRGHTSK